MRMPEAIDNRERMFRRIAIVVGIGLLLGWAARDLLRPYDGDFKVHWETGRRFLMGEFLYSDGHDFPYPPFFAMLFAPAALMSVPLAKLIFYPVAIIALLLLLWTNRRMICQSFHQNETQMFWTTALAIFLSIQFILRDQAELGLNTAVAALIWLSIYLWRQGRDLPAGISLAIPIALKSAPAIFICYFIWKRQWRVAIFAAAATLVLSVLPMLWQGPVTWNKHMQTWSTNAFHGVFGAGTGYEAGEMSRTQNMSLRPSLMSYLTRLPENSRRSFDPEQIEVLHLPRSIAGWIVNATLLSIVAIFAWWSRRPVHSRDDPRLLWEFAAAGVIMLLFSPITWSQHCVALLPACYLIAALVVTRDRLPVWIIVLLSIYILFCVILGGRDLIGRDLFYRIAAYHISTLCLAMLFAIVLAGPRLQSSRSR